MKKTLKSAAFLLSAVIFLTSCGGEQSSNLSGTGLEIPEYDIETRELPQSEALDFVKNMKIGWNLGNTLDADSKTSVEKCPKPHGALR